MIRVIRREFDPGFTPIFRRMVYQTPAGGVHTFIHHGVARFDRHAMPDPLIASCPMPGMGYGARFEHPNVVDRWFEARVVPGSRRYREGLPPAFVPWTEWVLTWARETYLAADAAEKKRLTGIQEEEAKHARESAEAEAAYIARDEAPRIKRLYESLTENDMKEARARQSGDFPLESKPFVDQGAHP